MFFPLKIPRILDRAAEVCLLLFIFLSFIPFPERFLRSAPFFVDIFLAFALLFFGISLIRGRVTKVSIGPKGIPCIVLGFLILLELQMVTNTGLFSASFLSLFRLLELSALYFLVMNGVSSLQWIVRVLVLGIAVSLVMLAVWFGMRSPLFFENASVSEIFSAMPKAVEQYLSLIQTHPVLGSGSGQFFSNIPLISNAFFLVAVEFGISGLLLFIAGIFFSIQTVLHERKIFSRREHRKTLLIVSGVTAVFFFTLILDDFLLAFQEGRMLLTLLLGIQAMLVEKEKKLIRPVPKVHSKPRESNTEPMKSGIPTVKA